MLYVALLPQFIDYERGSVALQSLTLGTIEVVVAVLVNALIALGARSLAARPLWLRAQRYVMGGVLGALAVRIATDRAPASA